MRFHRLNQTGEFLAGYKTVSLSVSSVKVWLKGCPRAWGTQSMCIRV